LLYSKELVASKKFKRQVVRELGKFIQGGGGGQTVLRPQV
jgi:hypothetical protein